MQEHPLNENSSALDMLISLLGTVEAMIMCAKTGIPIPVDSAQSQCDLTRKIIAKVSGLRLPNPPEGEALIMIKKILAATSEEEKDAAEKEALESAMNRYKQQMENN